MAILLVFSLNAGASDIPSLDLQVSHPGLRLAFLNYDSYIQFQVGDIKKTIYRKKCNQHIYDRLISNIKFHHKNTPLIKLPKRVNKRAAKKLLQANYPVRYGENTQLIPRDSGFGRFIDTLTNEVLFLEQRSRCD